MLVVDTNVLVSGLLNPFGKPGAVVNQLLSGAVRVAYDDRMLIEYTEVLSRPRFGFKESEIERLLAIFPFQELVVAAPWRHPPSPDPCDTMFLEVAEASGAILVTGNLKHFPEECRGPVIVMTPAQWLVVRR